MNTKPPQIPSPESDKAAKAMTAAQAAKLVKRVVVEREDGVEQSREKAIKESEVLSFKDYGTHVVVVTTAGEKLSNAKG